MGLEELKPGYEHTQASASTTWTITHNLGLSEPVVDCWVDDGGSDTRILPASVVATDVNVVTITFTTAYAGRAFVS